MKETKKNPNNNIHLYGYINGVRINPLENGRTAVNLDIATVESYKDKDGEFKQKYSHHDAAIFTSDEDTLKKFSAIQADLKANEANKDVEGYKPKSHTVSLDGMLVNRQSTFPGSDRGYATLAAVVREDSIDIDAKIAEGEKRNRVDFSANISKVNIYEDRKLALVSMAHNYRPNDSDKEYTTWMDVRVDGKSPFSKAAYEALAKGEVAKGDFVQVGGQLHDNNYDTELGRKYGNVIDLTSFKVLASKQEKTKTKEKKAEEKKSAVKKAEPKKKRSSGQKI